jgi:hypothetical protein
VVHNTLVGIGLRDKVKIGASGKIITAFDVARTLALGADWCNSARGFMFALGCIQSQSCHTDRCPTGVATQNPSAPVPWWCRTRPNASTASTRAPCTPCRSWCRRPAPHTSALRPHHIVRRINDHEIQLMSNVLKYLQPNDLLEGNYRYRVYEKFWPIARAESFHPEF